MNHFLTTQSAALVLGHDRTKEPVLAPLTTMFLKFAANRLLVRPDVSHGTAPDTWVILDEFRALNDTEAVPSLLNEGRSKGVSVLLAIQSIEGLFAKYESFGLTQSAAEELIGGCGSKCFLKLTPKTAAWAEACFGTQRVFERSFSHGVSTSRNDTTTSSTQSYSLQERSLFTASTFTGMPTLDSGNFVAITDVQGRVIIKRRATSTVLNALRAPSGEAAGERPLAHQRLPEWTEEEENNFCPPPDKEAPTATFPTMNPFKPK